MSSVEKKKKKKGFAYLFLICISVLPAYMSEHFYVCPMPRETVRGTPFLGLEIAMSHHVNAETRVLSSGRAESDLNLAISQDPELKFCGNKMYNFTSVIISGCDQSLGSVSDFIKNCKRT